MNSSDWMNERKLNILRAVINDYIMTAEPIGSRTIARKHELGLSSATIRNEMADLEEMGYLAQPHTSAGRIPSVKGYRLYVDHLIRLTELTLEEVISIRNAISEQAFELNRLMRHVTSILSEATGYISIATIPKMNQNKIKAVQVLPVEPGKLLVVSVAEGGIVRNRLVRISVTPDPNFVQKVSRVLNSKISGLNMNEINLEVIRGIKEDIQVPDSMLMPILDAVYDCIGSIDSNEAYVDGTVNLLGYPEFHDPVRVRELFRLLDEENNIQQLLNRDETNSTNVTISIGTENRLEQARDSTVVSTSCPMGDSMMSSIGIIGPTRMDYSRVISIMKLDRRLFKNEFEKLYNGNNSEET
ncbi:MAG TPA: heat-inducible transcription repressor HrcA [Clostridiales bacterium]|nr:heat-inducible transcription repressor HrcA [Clostridiales bacterium]